jgi:hypothetical protein
MGLKLRVNREKELEISHSFITRVLRYEPETGDFYWRECRGPNAQVGYLAGRKPGNHGYKSIRLINYSYLSHRLAWFYYYKKWPLYFIDHINRDRSDNRIDNLRDVSNSVNAHNSVTRKDNSTGVRGVYYNSINNNWRAIINIKGKTIDLGSYTSFVEAVHARKKAEEGLLNDISSR